MKQKRAFNQFTVARCLFSRDPLISGVRDIPDFVSLTWIQWWQYSRLRFGLGTSSTVQSSSVGLDAATLTKHPLLRSPRVHDIASGVGITESPGRLESKLTTANHFPNIKASRQPMNSQMCVHYPRCTLSKNVRCQLLLTKLPIKVLFEHFATRLESDSVMAIHSNAWILWATKLLYNSRTDSIQIKNLLHWRNG